MSLLRHRPPSLLARPQPEVTTAVPGPFPELSACPFPTHAHAHTEPCLPGARPPAPRSVLLRRYIAPSRLPRALRPCRSRGRAPPGRRATRLPSPALRTLTSPLGTGARRPAAAPLSAAALLHCAIAPAPGPAALLLPRARTIRPPCHPPPEPCSRTLPSPLGTAPLTGDCAAPPTPARAS